MTKVIRISYSVVTLLIGVAGLASVSRAQDNEQIHRCETGGCDVGGQATEGCYSGATRQPCSTKIDEEQRCCNDQQQHAGKESAGGQGCISNSVMTPPEQPKQTCCCKSEAVEKSLLRPRYPTSR